MKFFKIKLPSAEEISFALQLAEENPDELTDRKIWILEAFGSGQQ